MASLFIYKLKINPKLQEKTLARSAVSVFEAKILFLFWSVGMVELKQQRNRVCSCFEAIKTDQLECPLPKFKWYEISLSRLIIF